MTKVRNVETIITERLQLVLTIGQTHTERMRAQARVSGAQITVMGAEERLAEGEASAEHTGAVDDAYAQDDAARTELALIEARIIDLEDRLAALDRELAAITR